MAPSINEKISLMAGINYLGQKSYSGYSGNELNIPILATINLSNKKIAPFINIGGTEYISNFYRLDLFTFNVGFGTYFGNKILLAVNFEKGDLSDLINSDVNVKQSYFLSFKLGFRFK